LLKTHEKKINSLRSDSIFFSCNANFHQLSYSEAPADASKLQYQQMRWDASTGIVKGNSVGIFFYLVTCLEWRRDMRLDKFLKVSRLIKRRTVANEACDAGRVLVNEKPAKASVQVKTGDVLEIQFGTKSVKVEVLNVQETVKKEEASELYRYL